MSPLRRIEGYMEYPINTIYPCIQGEGVNTGIPMVLVRFNGCNLRCSFCDTKETWDQGNSHMMTGEQIMERVRKYPKISWVLLTGGEPGLYDIVSLIEKIRNEGYGVAIESNGFSTGYIIKDQGHTTADWVCISPKMQTSGAYQCLEECLKVADELKFIVKDDGSIPAIDRFIETRLVDYSIEEKEILLQPMSTDKIATEVCIKTVMERGWRLSLQIHKLVGIV
jgi:7-carboxy-7-deazaguanine synthase